MQQKQQYHHLLYFKSLLEKPGDLSRCATHISKMSGVMFHYVYKKYIYISPFQHLSPLIGQDRPKPLCLCFHDGSTLTIQPHETFTAWIKPTFTFIYHVNTLSTAFRASHFADWLPYLLPLIIYVAELQISQSFSQPKVLIPDIKGSERYKRM